MKYEDYFFLDIIDPREGKKVCFDEYWSWLSNNDFDNFKKRLCDGLGEKSIPEYDDDDLINYAFTNSLKNVSEKRKEKQYYLAQARIAMKMINKNKPSPSMLFDFLNDVEDLIEQYNCCMLNKKWQISTIDQLQNANNMFSTVESLLYNSSNTILVSANELSAVISLIRQSIELSIRNGFGVLSYIDATHNIIPISFSKLYKTIIKYEKKIQFDRNIRCIYRIYQWSNMYIHSGRRDYCWIPGFAYCYLYPFFYSNSSLRLGIKTTQDVINEICKSLANDSAKEQYELLKTEPQCVLK